MAGVRELSAILSKIGMIADILDEDVALYSFASQAVKEALSSRIKKDAVQQRRLENASE